MEYSLKIHLFWLDSGLSELFCFSQIQAILFWKQHACLWEDLMAN